MKFKLDENFGTRTQRVFKESGHDIETVIDEDLGGASDDTLFEHCQREKRCLVTLDLDFSDVLSFPPEKSSGIVVFRPPSNPSLAVLETLAHNFLTYLDEHSSNLIGRLWIIELSRIRIYIPDENNE